MALLSICCPAAGINSSGFADQSEQRQHFKSDWHRFNVKSKLAGRPTVAEAEFERIVDEQGEVWGLQNCYKYTSRGMSLLDTMHATAGVKHFWIRH